ncbi:Mariner Mos1 transposase [Anthophora plagiata]
MSENKEHFRHIMLFYFRKGKNALQTREKICAVYGTDAVDDSTCRKWFRKFKQGNFNLKDALHVGRPVTTNIDQMKTLIDNNRHATTYDIAQTLNVTAMTISRHTRKLGLIKKLDTWVPHQLTEKNITDRISLCKSLLERYKNEPFLNRLITGDEKWIVYNNVSRKRSWSKSGEPAQSIAKAGLHPKKVMLCIWWDMKGIVYFELLPPNKTIDSGVYCLQLEKLNNAIKEKKPGLANRKGVVFLHDNARPHTSMQTKNKLLQLGWEVLRHPPYSPDLAPTDFYLFRSLQNALNGINLPDMQSCQNFLNDFFSQKNAEFYKKGIFKLPKRWEKVINENGQYVIN